LIVDVSAQVADCFPRRDPRLLAREAVQAMLMELERRNRWPLAEALGHGGPHRLQHFLSCGVWDHDLARNRLAAWAAGELTDEEAVLGRTRPGTRSRPRTASAPPTSELRVTDSTRFDHLRAPEPPCREPAWWPHA
jgi:SRSO17 transposase